MQSQIADIELKSDAGLLLALKSLFLVLLPARSADLLGRLSSGGGFSGIILHLLFFLLVSLLGKTLGDPGTTSVVLSSKLALALD